MRRTWKSRRRYKGKASRQAKAGIVWSPEFINVHYCDGLVVACFLRAGFAEPHWRTAIMVSVFGFSLFGWGLRGQSKRRRSRWIPPFWGRKRRYSLRFQSKRKKRKRKKEKKKTLALCSTCLKVSSSVISRVLLRGIKNEVHEVGVQTWCFPSWRKICQVKQLFCFLPFDSIFFSLLSSETSNFFSPDSFVHSSFFLSVLICFRLSGLWIHSFFLGIILNYLLCHLSLAFELFV